MKSQRLNRVIVFDESGFCKKNSTDDLDEFVSDVVEDHFGRFAFFCFSSEIQFELWLMSAHRTRGKIEEFADRSGSKVARRGMSEKGGTAGMFMRSNSQVGSQFLMVER